MRSSLKLLVLILLAMPLSGFGQQDQDESLASLMATAQQAQARDDYAAAAIAYRQAVKIRPEIPELWANLGLMEHETNSYSEAIQSFQQAYRLKPSLYVPNLFLGIDFVHTGKAKEALPYLLSAEKMNAADLQPHLALGRAYSSLREFTLAAHEYSRATQLDAKQSQAWFSLGIAYLDQVEADARAMAEQGQNSAYAKMLYAESLASQSRYLEATDTYKAVIAAHDQPPCAHGELGFVYLRQHDVTNAEAEFNAETQTHPSCALATLGKARLRADAGSDQEALDLLVQLWDRDTGFVHANASKFVAGMALERSSSFAAFLNQESQKVPAALRDLLNASLQGDASQGALTAAMGSAETKVSSVSSAMTAQRDYAAGRYAQCANETASSLQSKNESELRMLTACSFLTGNYRLASRAGAVLGASSPRSGEALYWSIRANEQLAFETLDRYQQLEPDSERSHLLMGDIYVQRRRYDDAQTEYQKALEISPNDAAALLGLATAYFGDAKIARTIETAQTALDRVPDDPEINVLMGEALVADHEFIKAEPFLKKGLNAKQQMLPHVHALLGKVYAEAGRPEDAINELKLGLESDEDGSIHYQLARLYRQTGDVKDSAIAIEQMKAIEQRRRENAVIAVKDSHSSALDEEP